MAIQVPNNHHWFNDVRNPSKKTTLSYLPGAELVHHTWNRDGQTIEVKHDEFNLLDLELAVMFAGTTKEKTILDTMKIPEGIVFCVRSNKLCDDLTTADHIPVEFKHEEHAQLMGRCWFEGCCITFKNYGELFSFIFVNGEHPDSVQFYIRQIAEKKYLIYYDR